MPLKHATETLLVFFLGLAIAVTGFFTATLPHLPEGGLPWVFLLIIAILYPVSLSKLFKNNRADYPFRWLHWFPVFILVVWMAIELLAQAMPSLKNISSIYQWGWTMPLVIIGFLFIFAFCIHVIRRRAIRIALLLVIFIPFTVFAVMSEKGLDLDNKLASVLWNGTWWREINKSISGTGSGIRIAMNEKEPKNLTESVDPDEEAWRERLRAFERRRQMIENKRNQSADDSSIDNSEDKIDKDKSTIAEAETAPYTGTGREFREARTSPTALPSSGAPFAGIGLTMFMSYFSVLHSRAKKRII